MKTLVIYSLCLTMAAPAVWSADTAPLRGYSSEAARTQREWEAKFRAIPDPAALRAYMQRLAARPHHVGSPYDKDNAEWIAAKAKEWGLDAQIETFDVLFPTPKERALEMTEPTRVVAKIAEPAVPGDATSAQQNEQLPVYNAYSIDGDVTAPAGLRELRHPGRLRRTGPAGHLGEGRHRDRALRRKLARHQAQGGRRARRGRLPDLFRPARRRLRAGRHLPQRSVPPRRWRAARQRDGHAGLSRRSADSGSRRHQGRQAPRLERSQDPHHHSGHADFLRRRAAAAGRPEGTGGAGRMARRAAHHLSRRSRTRQGPPEAEVQLGPEDALQRDRAHSGKHVPRRVDHPRQSSRRVGQRRRRSGLRRRPADGRDARPGHAAEAGLEAQAHDHLLRVGRRGTRPARLHRVGGGARRGTAAQSRGLHQFRFQRPRLPPGGRLAHAGEVHQRRGPRYRRSGDEGDGVEAAAGVASGARRGRRRRTAEARTAPTCASARWAPARTTPRSSITSGSPP